MIFPHRSLAACGCSDTVVSAVSSSFKGPVFDCFLICAAIVRLCGAARRVIPPAAVPAALSTVYGRSVTADADLSLTYAKTWPSIHIIL